MSRREYQPYFIPRRNARCVGCHQLFNPEQTYYSSILEQLDGTVTRQDHCTACRTSGAECDVAWQGKIPPSATAFVNEAARCEKALELLRTFTQSEDPEEKNQAFVLALYLERRKQIVLRKEIWEGTKVATLLYEYLETGEMLHVPKVALDKIDLTLVAQQLGIDGKK
ncbi:MAG: hypothetical protein WC222_02835 [Parachlamydiales bacterium]|jgi:hypothetical protein